MLNKKWIPTHLVSPIERTPIRVRAGRAEVRFRIPYVLVEILKVCWKVLVLKVRGRLDGPTLGDLMRDYCQRMGVLWIKVGQLISMRADLASPEVRAELAKLQDRVDGFPSEMAIQQVEAELGVPLDRYLSEFSEMPIAAASVAQVHKARLKREGVPVAVKVRRPDIHRLCNKDLRLVRAFVRLLEWIGFRPEGRWREMLWELEEALREELDFRFEATNMRRMRSTLRRHHVYVPRVFEQYSTEGVLVMEFLSGVLMADYLQALRVDPQKVAAWREANEVDPVRVGRTLFHSLLRQVFEDNIFHSDLHPGNIVLLRGSRLAFLDFGSLGSMEQDFIRKVDLYIEAMSSRQYAKMIDVYFLFSHGLPATDLSECKNEMVRRLESWDARTRVEGLPFNDKSFNVIQDELVLFAARYGVSPVWTFFRMTRAMTTMDASLRELIPEADVRELTAAYYRGRTRRIMQSIGKKSLAETFNIRDWLDFQNRTVESAMLQGDIVRRDAAVFEGTTPQFAQFFGQIFGSLARFLLLVAVLLLGLLLFQLNLLSLLIPPTTTLGEMLRRIPRLDAQVWILVFALLAYSRRRLVLLRKRLMQRDARPTGERGLGV